MRPPAILSALCGILALAALALWLVAGLVRPDEGQRSADIPQPRITPAPGPSTPAQPASGASVPSTAAVPASTTGTSYPATTLTTIRTEPTSAETPGSVPLAAVPEVTPTIAEPSPTTSIAARDPGSFTMAATGDLLIHEAIARTARTDDGWDFTPFFSRVAPILRTADLAVCHIESPMSRDNRSISSFPRFSVPYQLADAVAYAGYDTCSLASNHSADTGLEGVIGTIEALDRVGVSHTGMARTPEERERLNLLDVSGALVAHLSYTYGLNTGRPRPQDAYMVNTIDEAAILHEAERARAAGADFIILSLHWGTEYRRSPDRYQTDLGPRLLSSPNVDLIIGHHAHVVQPVQKIGKEYLLYGVGNFLSNQSPRWEGGHPGTQDGVIMQLTVTEDTATGRWSVAAIAHTPTRVDLSTFEIINALVPGDGHHPATYANSAAQTARSLATLGTRVRAIGGPVSDPTRWLTHLLNGSLLGERSQQVVMPR